MKKKFQMSTVKKVLSAIKKYRLLLLLSIVLATVTVALSLYIPIIIGNAIDLIIDSEDWGKALGGEYTATITFTAEVVAG